MASNEFHAFQEAAAQRPVPTPAANVQEQRQRIDTAMSAIPLANGTTATAGSLGSVPMIDCRPDGLATDAPVIVYLHGGGFRIASALAYRSYGTHLAAALGARVVLVDYRLAPEHPFPAALDDSVAAYRALLAEGVDASQIVIAGDSAGGGLAASVALRTLAQGPVPGAIVCCSPWVDLTVTAATYETRSEADKLFSRTSAEEAALAYAVGSDVTDPLLSPVFGDWTGAPPMLVMVGDAEVLLDDAHRLAAVAGDAGVNVALSVYPEMPHIWTMSYPAFPEAVAGVNEIAAFVQKHVTESRAGKI
jgi:acetyl esterase/lipase